MASSKLYHHFSSSLFMFQKSKKSIEINRNISLLSSPLFLKASFYCSTSVSSAMLSSEFNEVVGPPPPSSPPLPSNHVWPEWDQFVEKLKKKGFFAKEDEDEPPSKYKKEFNRVKNACLKFARERYDIISYLPKEDIRTIAEWGCPNTFRKSINSAKRLRAFLRVKEGDVCGACNIRESCSRADIIENDDDKARTVDIVRLLMMYAVSPAINNSGETNISIEANVQESARNLLGELIKLSDTTIDPTFPIPEVQLQSKKDSMVKITNVTSNKMFHSVKMKAGDWKCPKCEFVNFARNINCRECKTDAPMKVVRAPVMKMGDWTCPKCEYVNFARNKLCRECKTDAPKRVDEAPKMKEGDWSCPKCKFINFARNKKCNICQGPRPERQLNPGEWECPKCDYLNFSKNTLCRKCDCKRPTNAEANVFEDHVWRNPRMARENHRLAKENKKFKFGDDEDDDEHEYKYLRKDDKKPRMSSERRGLAKENKNILFEDDEDEVDAEEDDELDYKYSRKDDKKPKMARKSHGLAKENENIIFGDDEDEVDADDDDDDDELDYKYSHKDDEKPRMARKNHRLAKENKTIIFGDDEDEIDAGDDDELDYKHSRKDGKNPRMARENRGLGKENKNIKFDDDDNEVDEDDDDELDYKYSRQDGKNVFAGKKKASIGRK